VQVHYTRYTVFRFYSGKFRVCARPLHAIHSFSFLFRKMLCLCVALLMYMCVLLPCLFVLVSVSERVWTWFCMSLYFSDVSVRVLCTYVRICVLFLCASVCVNVCTRACTYLQTAVAPRTIFAFLNPIFQSVDCFIIDFMIFNSNITFLEIIQRPIYI
jgi:hypothetical protein